MSEILEKTKSAAQAARKLAQLSSDTKNKALEAMAAALQDKNNINRILASNQADIKVAEKKGLSKSLIDRLALNEKRISAMVEGIDEVAKLPDPVGEILAEWTRPNGLHIQKVRVPLGTIGIVYEARPNVTVDAVTLCLKTGNAVILKGGSDALQSNLAITKIISQAAYSANLPKGAIQFIETTDRKAAAELFTLREYIDVLIPRGGAGLIKTVVESSHIPVIETGVGNCHVYVEKSADLFMAEKIVINAKCSRPSVCNALETLLVDEEIAEKFIPSLFKKLKEATVELRGDEKVCRLDPTVKKASEADWQAEYLDLILAVKIVGGMAEAISHITKYGTKHSESIITSNEVCAEQFLKEIDAAAVYVNASTRFTDGFEFGFGAEIGISTQKLHARGPMGLPELTTYKYLIRGDGQIRT